MDPTAPLSMLRGEMLEPPGVRNYWYSLLWRWRLGTFVATEPGEGNNRHPSIVSNGSGHRCMTTVAASTRFTATIA
jgi:hypothetical protein